jgi:hypothetical protein
VATTKFRWIMYLHNPLGGFELTRVASLEESRWSLSAYDEGTGFRQALQTNGEYGCSGTLYPYTEEAWEEAEEFRTSGCPFDYPSYEVKNGPRGGIRVIPVSC